VGPVRQNLAEHTVCSLPLAPRASRAGLSHTSDRRRVRHWDDAPV